MYLHHLSKIVIPSVCTLLLLQIACAQTLKGPPTPGTNQVNSSLATLSISVSYKATRHGAPIAVAVTLRAGPHGVFLPNFFQAFLQSCQNGFVATLLTQRGTRASPYEQGCALDSLHSGPGVDTAASELHNYVKLAPGETRTWHTILSTEGIPPGPYRLSAQYLSFGYMIDDVGRLPEVNHLMAKGYINAAPLPITLP